MDVTLHLAQDPEADALLGRSPLAALVDMLLDQQVPMEWAFTGPATIARRMGTDDLDAHEIVAFEPETFARLLSDKPAVHRYPASMAMGVPPAPQELGGGSSQLCQYLVEHYDGDPEAIWRDVDSGRELLRRLEELPGFGKQKAQIFLALLGKQLGVRPTGWREAAGAYGEPDSHRSVADITGPDSLTRVRAHKQELKAAAKAAKSATPTRTVKTAKTTGTGRSSRAGKGTKSSGK
ncbi:HhH-GPD-type base excision DNA repair protein [Streptomyces sp. NPDC127105]|uniref:HhH-GPD-type base excision DNA repair protein n=1 Tax=Streptomyces sp. NPDC127105 TaxID=3345359 RepID=UPI00364D8937